MWIWVDLVDLALFFIFHYFGRSPQSARVSQCVPVRTFTLCTERTRTCVKSELVYPAKILKILNFTL